MSRNNIIMEKSNDLKLMNNKQKELEMKQENDREMREFSTKEVVNANK